jgi:hypothetical protein
MEHVLKPLAVLRLAEMWFVVSEHLLSHLQLALQSLPALLFVKAVIVVKSIVALQATFVVMVTDKGQI